ncbi:MAG: hypothetical protein B6D59_05810 [Campylobacteraceae bacterium 4484_4]|nr:MAG: hypothetical protein B6D59_05810 [Campylobacteraceae bacterium 4484_4]
MRYLPVLLLASLLGANEPDFGIETTLYTEMERIKAHPVDSGGSLPDISLEDETQKLTTFYTILNYTLPDKEEKWVLNLEGRAALELGSDDYTNPVYRALYSDEKVNRAILSEASIDYYSTDFAWSVGRNRLDLDWLSGSFDSVMVYGVGAWIEARAFWFVNYYDFQYNYYTKYTGINDDKGIAGFYLQSGEALQNWEWAWYYYHVFDEGYLSGVKLFKPLKFLDLNAAYSYLDAIGDGRLPKESFFRLWAEMERGEHHSFAFGFSQTGENGLSAMLRFGAHTFSQFYLTGAVDRSKAKNIYLSYRFESDRFEFETVGGITSYHDKSLEENRLVDKEMDAYEIDLHASYALNDHTTVTLGYMLLDLDEQDTLNFDQDLLSLSVSAQWP